MQVSHSFRNPAREIRSTSPLSDDQLRSVAPSIFAPAPHESRSARYTYIPTSNVLAALRREGFEAFYAGQSRTRDASRREYTRHMLRLRHASTVARVVGDSVPEIALINSHDGSSSYQMFAGVLRLICTNGLIAGESFETFKVPHSGNVVGRVIEGAYSVVEDFDRVRESAEEMRALTLSTGEQRAFGTAAIVAKYGEQPAPITVDQVLDTRRHDDRGADLWSTFNRVQENLVRGGIRHRTANGRRNRTRAVQGISENVQLNRALWTLADQLKQLKAA